MSTSFKDRVVQVAIAQAPIYKSVFVDFEYLICASAFKSRPYFIIAAKEDNYRHLIGINTSMSASDFFDACISSTLTIDDFDFKKKNRTEKEVKGSVRKKIKVLPLLMGMMTQDLVAQEHFSKNAITCAFATTDCNYTVGFVDTGKSRPMTLLSGDELDWSKSTPVDLILRRPSGTDRFDTVMYGNPSILSNYFHTPNEFLAESLIKYIP